jgi:hypothetical protein
MVCAGSSGCRERAPVLDSAGEVTTESREPAAITAAQRPPDAKPPADGCIRGGTPRAEVRALLGEPDSISWGVWLYGRSEITFGYGVVVAYEDHEENLSLC